MGRSRPKGPEPRAGLVRCSPVFRGSALTVVVSLLLGCSSNARAPADATPPKPGIPVAAHLPDEAVSVRTALGAPDGRAIVVQGRLEALPVECAPCPDDEEVECEACPPRVFTFVDVDTGDRLRARVYAPLVAADVGSSFVLSGSLVSDPEMEERVFDADDIQRLD